MESLSQLAGLRSFLRPSLAGPERFQRSSLPFVGLSRPARKEVLDALFPRRRDLLRRGFVARKVPRSRGALPAARHAEHHQLPRHQALPRSYPLARPDRVRGFGGTPVHLHPALPAGLGGLAAGLVGTHHPQPLVQAGIVKVGGKTGAFHTVRLRPRGG